MGAQGGMNMKMTMGMIVADVEEEIIKTESQITSIVMDMMQGGMTMNYDSNKSDEELDQMGQMLKSQFAPMMEAVIYNTLDLQGNMIDTKLDPAIPGMEQITNRSMNTINYPKEKVSVGSSWTSENENQGMKMTTKYTVSQYCRWSCYFRCFRGYEWGRNRNNSKENQLLKLALVFQITQKLRLQLLLKE